MRVITWVSLFFGFIGLMLLDGQTFFHAVMGLICGIVAMGGGLACARKDYASGGRRWGGRGVAILGLGLTVYCAIQLPSAYKFQNKFNARSNEFHQRTQANPTADFHALGLDRPSKARALFELYRHVFTAHVSEDNWENTAQHKRSLHHFKATVTKVYKGDWSIGEKVSFCYGADIPTFNESNALVGSNMLLLAYRHDDNEIDFGLGDFFLVDTNVEQELRFIFQNDKQ